jgi:hypothetical protein
VSAELKLARRHLKVAARRLAEQVVIHALADLKFYEGEQWPKTVTIYQGSVPIEFQPIGNGRG